MDDELLEIVLRRLEATPLAEQAADLLLAALEGDESLAAQLSRAGSTTGEQRPRFVQPIASTRQPASAYLRSLTVSGFRGIGQPATLSLTPGPGLTVVVGRNGSGKSSFAEALEVLLTGKLRRWENLPVVWKQGWRSMHQPEHAEITAEFLVEGGGPATARRTWGSKAGFEDSAVEVQVQGEKKAGLDRLGWSQALTDYRPFLAHSELEAFFGSPSGVYELIASVLGLDDLTTAATRLQQARLERVRAFKEVEKRLPELRVQLEDAQDERAGFVLNALEGRTWDLAAARLMATDARPTGDGGELDRLRRLAQLALPSEEDVRGAAAALREAADGLEAIAGTVAGRSRALAELLTAALRHHQAHEDGDCPVCKRPGALTTEWRQATEDEVARLNREAKAAGDAERTATDASHRAAALLQQPPPVLSDEPPRAVDPVPATATWRRWASPPAGALQATGGGLRALADHLDLAFAPLMEAVRALSAEAAEQHSERDASWSPVAAAVTSWCEAAVAAQDSLAPVESIKAAEAWLKAATDAIRNDRLAPLANQARSIWGMLRQESNVDLGAIRLSGSSNQRRLELDVSVDGVPGSALGVMSQGEVNALALSVFLPRARLPASPFRFLVIDDPVQAMDPAKVDGLARVLEKAAADRQLIVFTHDNRLAEAVRQLRIPATVLEVTRQPGSHVWVRRWLDPVTQALRDARALIADKDVPAEVAARVVPGLCRTAVEAAFTEAVWRQQLRDGRGRAEIEAALESAGVRLTSLAALALTGNADRGSDVQPRLGSWGRAMADTFRALNRGAHGANVGDVDLMIRDAQALVEKIRANLS
jgi:energy-coupling factor transporter ATP-binding protein EcfA2